MISLKGFFFDRDGVINQLVDSDLTRGPRRLSELVISEDAVNVVSELTKMGYHCEIVSNQPDIARGLLTIAEHEGIQREISRKIPSFSTQRYCTHSNEDNCICRKPKPGLLFEAEKEFQLDLSLSFMIGDKWTDILAARSAGVTSILLRNASSWNSTSQGTPPKELRADFEIKKITEVLELVQM